MELQIDSHLHQNITDYYVGAGLDYAYWSPSRNMHFGFGSPWSILSRERMLNRMSDEVFKRLRLDSRSSLLADLGCGVGTVSRRAARMFPQLNVVGITLVPLQKEHAERSNHEQKLHGRVSIRVEDYHQTSLDSDCCDGVLMMESACYSPPNLHELLFSEVYRITKPGGCFAIGDGFLKTMVNDLPESVRKNYHGVCRNWSLPGMMHIDQTIRLLRRAGFQNVQAEEISWKVAPSVLHVPFVIARYLLDKVLTGETISHQSKRHLTASLQALLLGLRPKHFGYFLIRAVKSR